MATPRVPPPRASSLLQRGLAILAAILRVLLTPLRLVVNYWFRIVDGDGLTARDSAKAALLFRQHLRQNKISDQHWSTTGFQAAKDRALDSNQLLLVYLYSPIHPACQTFVQRSMPGMDRVLSQVVALGFSVTTAQGWQLTSSLQVSAYPFVAILEPKSPTQVALLFRAQGPTLVRLPPDELLMHCETCITAHQTHMAEQEVRRLQREQEAELRRQQDEEYQRSLHEDRERERLQQEERQRAIMEKKRQEEEVRQQELAKQRALEEAQSKLRDAPASGGANIRFVLPSGTKLVRRFYEDDTIGHVKAFLKVHFEENDVSIANFSVSTSYPKKTYEDESVSVEEAQLCPQAVLMVQDLDA